MLELLHHVEGKIGELMQDRSEWKSVFVDYEHPYVERLWRPYEGNRINLHRIHPCKPEQALFHPHPWPSAMRILQGRYEMAIGFTKGNRVPPIAAKVILGEGDEYEMTHPDGWHFVRPLGLPTMSLMVTGTPWERESPKSTKRLDSLSEDQQARIFEFISAYYQRLR